MESILILVADLTCGQDYTLHGSSCYRAHNERVHWQVAQDTCAAENGRLVEVADADEQTFLSGLYRCIINSVQN